MKTRQSGIALIESLVAVVILAIGLIGTIGLQARAMSAMAEASMRAEATIATEKLLGIMTNDQGNLASYALASGGTPDPVLQAWYDETRTFIPNASIVVAVTPVASTKRTEVDITIQWTRKQHADQNTHKVIAYISASS